MSGDTDSLSFTYCNQCNHCHQLGVYGKERDIFSYIYGGTGDTGDSGDGVGLEEVPFPYMGGNPELWGAPFVARLTTATVVTTLSARWIAADPGRSAKFGAVASEKTDGASNAGSVSGPRRTVTDTAAKSDETRSKTTLRVACVQGRCVQRDAARAKSKTYEAGPFAGTRAKSGPHDPSSPARRRGRASRERRLLGLGPPCPASAEVRTDELRVHYGPRRARPSGDFSGGGAT